jgi:hypothetical protein
MRRHERTCDVQVINAEADINKNQQQFISMQD